MRYNYAFGSMLLFFASLCSFPLFAQAEKLSAIETSLRPDLIVEGASLWNMANRMEKYHVPGISIAVVEDFKLAGARTYGKTNSGLQEKPTNETAFQAASVSKLVNAIGVMKLVEEGKLDLDEDINKVLRKWQLTPNFSYLQSVVTTRMLLAHTAGLSTHGFGGYKSGEDLPSAIGILNKADGVNSDAVRIIKKPGDADRLLLPATAQSMLVPPVSGENNALGLFLQDKNGHVYFEHGGSNEGFKALFVGSTTTGDGAVIMHNGEQYDLIPEVLNAIAHTYTWPAWFGLQSTIPGDLVIDKSIWKDYKGNYVQEGKPEISFDISIKKRKLRISRPKAWNLELIGISETTYLLKGANPAATVEFLADGRLKVMQGEVVFYQKK